MADVCLRRASLLMPCRFVIFEALDAHFVEVVLPQLGLCGPEANDAHFRLKHFITDVLVTRNWFSHGRSLSLTQVVRAMTSLLAAIVDLRCDDVSQQHATAVITACIADVRACTVPGAPLTMTVNSISCLFFIRALQRLCKALNVSDITKEALAANGPTSQDMKLVKECVWDGRCYLYHGKCNRKAMALLVCTCAASRLLRSLGPAFAHHAEDCDADIMQLLARMNLCEEQSLIAAVSEGHKATYAIFSLAFEHVLLCDLACRLSSCPYAAALNDDKMAHIRHLIWRIVPVKCSSASSMAIDTKSRAMRTRITGLVNVVKFVPNAASASRELAIAWLLSSTPHLSAIARAESCSQPATAADIDV